MALPGIWEEKELKPLLKKLMDDGDLTLQFAVVASGPKEGWLVLDRKQKLKKPEMEKAAAELAESDPDRKKKGGGKNAKFDIMTGRCRLESADSGVLRIIANGRAPAKAVACAEHLLVRGPYKSIGFTGVVLEETGEEGSDAPEPEVTPGPGGQPEEPGVTDQDVPKAPDPEALRFAQRLKPIKSDLDRILAASLEVTAEAKKVFAQATAAFKAQDYSTAHEALDRLEPLVRAGAQALAGANTGTDDAGVRFNERLKALLPGIKAAAGTPAGDQARLRASEAGVLAKKRDFVQANALLDEVDELLSPAGGEEPLELSPDFDQAWKRAKQQWEIAMETIDGQLEKLRGHLLQAQDADLKGIAEIGLNAITANHRVPLQAALMDIDRSTGPARVKAIDKAQDAIFAFREHIDRDERVDACDDNPFGVQVTLRAELTKGLTALGRALEDALV
ncbi:MAG: hypothetical protein AB7Q97_18945 [Gammaproteobacteria bacterium]